MKIIPNLRNGFELLLQIKHGETYYRETSAASLINYLGVDWANNDVLISFSPLTVSDLKQTTFDIVLATPDGSWTEGINGTWVGDEFVVYYYQSGNSFIAASGRLASINKMYKTDSLGERIVKLTGGSPTYSLNATAPLRISRETKLAPDDISFEQMHDDFSKLKFTWGKL